MFSGDCWYFQCCWHRTDKGSGHTLEHRKNDDLWSCCQKLTLSKQEVGGVAARKWQARWSVTGFKLLRRGCAISCYHPSFVWLFGREWQMSDLEKDNTISHTLSHSPRRLQYWCGGYRSKIISGTLLYAASIVPQSSRAPVFVRGLPDKSNIWDHTLCHNARRVTGRK